MSAPPNSRSTLWFGAVIVFFAMAALGWSLGRGGSSENEEPAQADSKSGRSSAKVVLAKARERERARGRVSAIRRGGTPEQRMRATIELANSLHPDQFPDWMDGSWFDLRSGFELTLFRRIIEERWRTEDPEGFVAWCLADGEHGPAWATSKPKNAALPILNEWAISDPERLSSFFDNYPDDDLEAQLISRLVKKNPELAVQRLKDLMERGGSGHYQVQEAVRKLARQSPELAEELLDELPASLRIEAESVLVAKRLEASFKEEINALWARPDGWRLFANLSHSIGNLSDQLLAELPNLPASWRGGLSQHSLYSLLGNGNPEPWISTDLEAAGFSEEQALRVRTTALSVLASNNPERALALLDSTTFAENFRQNLLSNIFLNARSNPEKIETLLASLGSEADRETARTVLEQASPTRTTPPNRNYNTPDDWLGAVAETDAGDSNRYQLGYTLRQWSPEQLNELTTQFRDLAAEEKDQVAEVVIQAGQYLQSGASSELIGEAVLYRVVEAQEAAADQGQDGDPSTSSGMNHFQQTTQLASTTAVRWVQQDAEAASAWVRNLPDGQAKEWAQRNMAATWAQYDPEAMERWLGALPTAEQAEVRGFLEGRER